ncbi:MAG: radical SAM protein, partial [Thermoplasmata archaeon]
MDRYCAIREGKEKARYLENRERIENLVERAWEIYSHCTLCEHRCGVNRNTEEGICGVRRASIATHFMHYGEEEILVPSYTIFFSGCNFKCIYCQNWDISQRRAGIYIEPERIAYLINGLYGVAKNINWVGGEPTPNLPYILEVLRHCNANIPQIWNSNMYCS